MQMDREIIGQSRIIFSFQAGLGWCCFRVNSKVSRCCQKQGWSMRGSRILFIMSLFSILDLQKWPKSAKTRGPRMWLSNAVRLKDRDALQSQ